MAKTPAEFDHMTHDVPPTSDMGGALTPAALASAKKKKHRSRPLFDDRASSLAATAQVQADLLATASDLYRRIEADPHGLRDDEAYWKSLPAHLRTFIRNALPLGQFGQDASADTLPPRHASTQAMIAVAQQLAQAAHGPQAAPPMTELYRAKQRYLSQLPNMPLPVGEDGDLVFVDDLDYDDDELAYASDDTESDKKKKKLSLIHI